VTDAWSVGLARRAAALGGAGLLAMAAGFLREVALARRFGVSATMDAYVAATFVSRLSLALVSGSLLPAFILVFVRTLERDEQVAWAFARAATRWMGALTLGACAAAAATASRWLPVFYPGYTGHQLASSVHLTMLLLPSVPILLVSSVQSGILNARGRFALPVLGAGAGSLVVIAAAVLISGPSALDWVVGATAVSYLIQWAVQQPFIRHDALARTAPASPLVKEWLLLGLPLLLYQGAAYVSNIMEGRLASAIGPGAVSALGYAARLFSIPTALLAAPLAIVAYPSLVRRMTRGDAAGAREVLAKAMRVVIFAFLPASAVTIVCAAPLTALFLQRGAFDATATATTASALAAYAVGMAPNALAVLLLRGLNAAGDMRTPLYAEMVSLAVYLAAAIPLAATVGVAGLAGARAVGFTSTALLLLYVLSRRLDLLSRALAGARYTAKALGLSASLALVVLGAASVVTAVAGSATLGVRASLQLLGAGLALAGYLAAAKWWLRWPEADLVLQWIPGFRSRGGMADDLK